MMVCFCLLTMMILESSLWNFLLKVGKLLLEVVMMRSMFMILKQTSSPLEYPHTMYEYNYHRCVSQIFFLWSIFLFKKKENLCYVQDICLRIMKLIIILLGLVLVVIFKDVLFSWQDGNFLLFRIMFTKTRRFCLLSLHDLMKSSFSLSPSKYMFALK